MGLMGSGKTSAGRMAAERLRVPFHDIDELVTAVAGMSIPEVWASLGEEGFRRLEAAAVANVAGEDGIVATGGGVVLAPENRIMMSDSSKVVWLTGSPTSLASRIDDTGERPLLARSETSVEQSLAELLVEREHLYREVATHVIDTTGRDLAEVSRQIEGIWNA